MLFEAKGIDRRGARLFYIIMGENKVFLYRWVAEVFLFILFNNWFYTWEGNWDISNRKYTPALLFLETARKNIPDLNKV